MPLAVAFWVLMLISVIFYFVDGRSPTPRFPWGGSILEFILFAILGWAVFGAAIK